MLRLQLRARVTPAYADSGTTSAPPSSSVNAARKMIRCPCRARRTPRVAEALVERMNSTVRLGGNCDELFLKGEDCTTPSSDDCLTPEDHYTH
jgi:hypothetical protein